MQLKDCYRTEDFRCLARRRLPSPIFHYIDGGADDESTLRRNTAAFDDVDLVPSVLAGIDSVDLSVEVLGARLRMPLFFAPTALQRLFITRASGPSHVRPTSSGRCSASRPSAPAALRSWGALTKAPKLFQIYVHKDAGLTTSLIERCRAAGFNALALTVDTIVAGNPAKVIRRTKDDPRAA